MAERKTTGDTVTSASSSSEISTKLPARNTGMSFQRTRLSADRTLMSVIRTATNMIFLAGGIVAGRARFLAA
jgi:uncharacterized membrane protein YidH (DUF202 family)